MWFLPLLFDKFLSPGYLCHPGASQMISNIDPNVEAAWVVGFGFLNKNPKRQWVEMPALPASSQILGLRTRVASIPHPDHNFLLPYLLIVAILPLAYVSAGFIHHHSISLIIIYILTSQSLIPQFYRFGWEIKWNQGLGSQNINDDEGDWMVMDESGRYVRER